jgi:hypothetical protein
MTSVFKNQFLERSKSQELEDMAQCNLYQPLFILTLTMYLSKRIHERDMFSYGVR